MRTLEWQMANQPAGTDGLGFRQLIEDGPTILYERAIDPKRRRFVLDDLSKLLLQVKQGSELVRNNALFVATADRSVYDSFSLFDRFLEGAESERWNSVLDQAEGAVIELRANKHPDMAKREAAIELLQRILSGLIREPKPGIPNHPEELRIDG
jgi:hypothetical protein